MPAIQFNDPRDISDLVSYLERAKKLDPDGLVKFRGFHDVLAVYVSPIFSASLLSDGPTVLGLRTLKLPFEHQVDVNFELSAILERLVGIGEDLSLELPPVQQRAAWTGITPPRDGWESVGTLSQEQVTAWAKDGIAEVASAIPQSVGSSIANKVRLQVWGRSVGDTLQLPAGAAFALSGLGFMSPNEEVRVFKTRGWLRLSTQHGHVLCKEAPSLV